MNTKNHKNVIVTVISLGILLLPVFNISNSVAAKNKRVSSPEQCINIVSALDRLECFDVYFKAPVRLSSNQQGSRHYSTLPNVMTMALNQERLRKGSDLSLIRKSYLERDDNEQQRVMLTAPALSGFLPRPLLIISCVQNITRFQIGLKEKMREGEVRLNLELDGRHRYQDYLWRVVGNDHLVDAGRGLPGIEFIKTLFHHQRLKIHSDNSRIDGLSFDISQLSEKIRPLRTSCHW